MGNFKLTTDQEKVVEDLLQFFKQNKYNFHLIDGAAGTGKTSSIVEFANQLKGRLIFTAPTNKATRVLRETFHSDRFVADYNPQCCTIYSLLGLRLAPNGEIKELQAPDGDLNLSRFKGIVIDEGSMVGPSLEYYIKECVKSYRTKVIYMGDSAQLPPVLSKKDEEFLKKQKRKLTMSPIWDIQERSSLTTVMRHDNQILKLATHIREKVDLPFASIQLKSDNDGQEGVWKDGQIAFIKKIREAAEAQLFLEQSEVKAIAWRNKTVDRLTAIIRQQMFSNADDYIIGDRIIMLEPAKDILEDESGFITTTDEEGTISKTNVSAHPLYPEFMCYNLAVDMDEGRTVRLWKLHPSSNQMYQKRLADLANAAKVERRKWKNYWNFKESFHNFRYAYAITAHRAQGSTYNKVFVDSSDILANWDKAVAFRCLYVACTRPRKSLILG